MGKASPNWQGVPSQAAVTVEIGRSRDERQGETSVPETFLTTRSNRRAWRGSVLFLAILLVAAVASATENGGSVYPVGVETVKPGLTPPPNGSVIFEFTAFYSANQMNNSAGMSVAPEFKLSSASTTESHIL